MNYSTKLCQSLDAIRALANPLDFAKIEELIESASESVQPHVDKLATTSNMLEFIGASLFGDKGTLSLFFNQNKKGEVEELSIKFSSSSPIGRDLEHNVVDFRVREINQEAIEDIKPGKLFSIGYLTHQRNTRSNRNIQQLSKFSVAVKKEHNGKLTLVSHNAAGEDANDSENTNI